MKIANESQPSVSSFIDTCLTIGRSENQPPIRRFLCNKRSRIALTDARTTKSVEDEIANRHFVEQLASSVRIELERRQHRFMSSPKVSQMGDGGCNHRSRRRVASNPFESRIKCMPFASVSEQFQYSLPAGGVKIAYGLHQFQKVRREKDLHQQHSTGGDRKHQCGGDTGQSEGPTPQPIPNCTQSEQHEEQCEWRHGR